jgi:hypothetical protein
MKIQLWFFITLALIVAGCQKKASEQPAADSQKRFDPSKSDAEAIRIADEIMVALGGRENYDAVQYISFHFVVTVGDTQVTSWRHDWDRRKNNYRLEGKTREGDHLLAVFNLDTQSGTVFMNGQMLEGEDKIQWLSRAYARYINDTYWLLMPYKLKDPGVILKHENIQEINSVQYDMLRLQFDEGIGLTPQNVYRIFVDPATRLVHRWEYFESEGANSSPAWWENWRVYEGIMLAEQRSFENSNRKLLFTNIVASRQVDEKIFDVSSVSTARIP